MSVFDTQFEFGQDAETAAEKFLIHRCGYHVVPVTIVKNLGLGPSIWGKDKNDTYPLPDLLVFRDTYTKWVEVKRKGQFAWNRTHELWVTGIDIHRLDDYAKIEEITNIPVHVFFLHDVSINESPTGLYESSLTDLIRNEHHRYEGKETGSKTGIIYWRELDLNKLATIEQLKDRE